jgi:hypothetical protein
MYFRVWPNPEVAGGDTERLESGCVGEPLRDRERPLPARERKFATTTPHPPPAVGSAQGSVSVRGSDAEPAELDRDSL